MMQYNLEVGNVVIGLIIRKMKLYNWLSDYFLQKSSDKEAQIILRLIVTSGKVISMVPDSLYQSKKVVGNKIYFHGGLLKGEYDHTKKFGTLYIHPVLVSSEASRVFEQILYQAYFSILKEAYEQFPLVHSCGVIRNQKGYLFLGPSEAGKSTIAKLSEKYQVINDEITIIDISGASSHLYSTPFNGLYRGKVRGSAPLYAIFSLHKSLINKVTLLKNSSAIKPVAQQIIPPIGIVDTMKSEIFLKQLDIATNISVKVPIYQLDFKMDSDFWKEIDNIEN